MIIIDLPQPIFDAVRTGTRCWLSAPLYATVEAGDKLYVRCDEQSTCLVVKAVETFVAHDDPEVLGKIVSVHRPWTNSEDDLNEDALSKIEELCAEFRVRSHVPYTIEDQRSTAGQLHNFARMLHLSLGGYRERK